MIDSITLQKVLNYDLIFVELAHKKQIFY